ncbi:MAG: hypothetical protein JNM22_06150 [Saprospiraceae bacterium]|nr:hypothetical protein [Saprospiraceae bacterium]
MKFLSSIFLPFALMLVFLAAPTSNAFACGGGESCGKREEQKGSQEKSCCSQETDYSKPCNDKKDRGGDCGKKNCHCPTTFSHGQIAVAAPLKLALPIYCLPKKAAWYYLNKTPSAVYLSIWLPPKISC